MSYSNNRQQWANYLLLQKIGIEGFCSSDMITHGPACFKLSPGHFACRSMTHATEVNP
jgi:hypothetical protein